jgi:hypothetical protein
MLSRAQLVRISEQTRHQAFPESPNIESRCLGRNQRGDRALRLGIQALVYSVDGALIPGKTLVSLDDLRTTTGLLERATLAARIGENSSVKR